MQKTVNQFSDATGFRNVQIIKKERHKDAEHTQYDSQIRMKIW